LFPCFSGRGRHDAKTFVALARQFATSVERESSEPPVLLKHLPSWETAQPTARYAVSPGSLRETIGSEPVFDAVSFAGGTEVVAANYDPAKLVIFEFTTPQLASENDRRIIEKIDQLPAACSFAALKQRLSNSAMQWAPAFRVKLVDLFDDPPIVSEASCGVVNSKITSLAGS